jgi:hypothetical protein
MKFEDTLNVETTCDRGMSDGEDTVDEVPVWVRLDISDSNSVYVNGAGMEPVVQT